MELRIVDELYRASTALNQSPPHSIEQVTTLKSSTAAFQLLFHDKKTCQVSLTGDYAIPVVLDRPIYRVVVEAPFAVSLRFVDYYEDSNEVAYADKISEGTVRTIPANRYGVVYASIATNKVAAGNYELSVKVYQGGITTGEHLVAAQSIMVTVDELVQPQAKLDLDIWQQPSNLARTFDVPLWSEAHFKLIGQMATMLAESGETAITVMAAETPWKGWFSYIVKDHPANLFEYSMVKVGRDNGKIVSDFSILDRYVETFMAAGVKGYLEVFGLLGVWTPPFFPLIHCDDYPEPIVVRVFDVASGEYDFIKTRAEVTDYLRQVFDHLARKGWLDQTYICADEPQPDQVARFRTSVEALKQIEPKLKFKVALDRETVANQLLDLVDVPALSFYTATKRPQGYGQFYICNYPPRPNTYLQSQGAETRLLGSLVYAMATDGLLRWAFNCWPDQARTDIRFNTANLPAGDLCLAYPGPNGNLLPSLRLMQLRRGFEDLALIQTASVIDSSRVAKLVAVLLGKPVSEWMSDRHHTAPDAVKPKAGDFVSLRSGLYDILKGQA